MGKKTKQFIAKGEGQHFFVLRRSQRDEAHATEEKPSDFVLVPSNQSTQRAAPTRSIFSSESRLKDHVTSLGFANDGYDYSQHLKPMGGGVFVGRDGHKVNSSTLATSHDVQLPADSLPSERELDRNLQAITINEELMDDDIREALFDDEDGGEFEELDDNFVEQAMEEPKAEASTNAEFDFDAHIQWLIEQSERALNPTSKRGPRGWEEDGAASGGGKWLPRRIRGTDENECEDEDEDLEEFSDYVDSDGEQGKSGRREGATHDEIDEEEFDKLADEYDDDYIGDLEGDSDVEGVIDITTGSNALLDEILNEHIENQRDIDFEIGVKAKAPAVVPAADDEAHEDVEITAEQIKAAYREQMLLQAVNALPSVEHTNSKSKRSGGSSRIIEEALPKKMGMLELIDVGEVPDESLLVCQEYLREEQKRDEWDCESVLSTYSITDNHPSLIKGYGSRLSKASKGTLTAAVPRQLPNQIQPTKGGAVGQNSTSKIVLKGKYLLPAEVIASDQSKSLSRVQSSSTEQSAVHPISAPLVSRDRNETAEEKRKRKAEVKEFRRSRRTEKKSSKEIEKSITLKQQSCTGRSAVNLDHVSVFKYSS